MAAQSTYTSIQTYTSTGSTAVFTFSNIPQTYTDLIIAFYARDAFAINLHETLVRLNGDTGSNYSNTRLYGDGSTAYSQRNTNLTGYYPGPLPAASATSGVFGSQTIHFMNYSNTTTYKSALARTASDLNGSGQSILSVNMWRNTAAINSILIQNTDGTNYVSGTQITLYGIQAA